MAVFSHSVVSDSLRPLGLQLSRWILRVGNGQGGLTCCASWGCKESETTEQLNWTELDWSTPGFPVLDHFPALAQTHVHWVSDAIQPSHPLSFPSSPAFSLSQHQGLFPVSWLFISGGQSIGASASASIPPMNIQDWFPLGLTGLISLQSKGVRRVFSNTTVEKHQFFGVQLSL